MATCAPRVPPVLDLTDPENPCHDPAFLGFRFHRGDVAWAVCAYCPGKNRVDAEARRLGLAVTHSICPACSAKMIARITGDRSE